MKKTHPKKLTLSRETLTALTADQARAAQGGLQQVAADAAPLTGDSKNVCCC
jgi:hypothetical protein